MIIIDKIKEKRIKRCSKCSISPMCETFIMLEENCLRQNRDKFNEKELELAKTCGNYTTKELKEKDFYDSVEHKRTSYENKEDKI